MLHAIIDIGSNTIRMAVYQIEDDAFTMLMKRKHTAGLAGCLADGRLTREGVDLTIKILGGFVDLIDALTHKPPVREIARKSDRMLAFQQECERTTLDLIDRHADGVRADVDDRVEHRATS